MVRLWLNLTKRTEKDAVVSVVGSSFVGWCQHQVIGATTDVHVSEHRRSNDKVAIRSTDYFLEIGCRSKDRVIFFLVNMRSEMKDGVYHSNYRRRVTSFSRIRSL